MPILPPDVAASDFCAYFHSPGPPPYHVSRLWHFVCAANAVSMMLFGGLGALVGLLAFKRISPPAPTSK